MCCAGTMKTVSAELASDGTSEAATLVDNRRKRTVSPEKGHYLRTAMTRLVD